LATTYQNSKIYLNKSLCSYPWVAAAIRPNGATIPCCRYPNLEDEDVFIGNDDPRNSKHWKQLRQDILDKKLIEGCKSCYQDEKNNLYSMRLESLSKFIPINNEIVPLEKLEVALSNLCNLACAHCSSYFSSKWYTEDVKAGRSNKKGAIQNEFNIDHWNLSQLTDLKIIGGEPFMEQKRFTNLLKNLDLSKISLQICTNGTILPNNELKALIESCKNVYLCVSLDGLYSTNDWYRWPSKFSDVISNMKIYESWWSNYKNISPIIHCVINAINIFELDKFINYMRNNFGEWRIEWDWIRWPHWQELSVFPSNIKKNLIDKLTIFNAEYNDKDIRPNPYRISIERMLEPSQSDWNTHINEIKRISKERDLNHLTMIPYYNSYLQSNENNTVRG